MDNLCLDWRNILAFGKLELDLNNKFAIHSAGHLN